MKEAAEILRFVYGVYALGGGLFTAILWLARMSYTQMTLKRAHEETKADVKELRNEMQTRKENDVLYKTMLNQILEGQKELKNDFRQEIKDIKQTIKGG